MIRERVILADGCIYSSDPEETGLNNNVACVGGPGSGKTESILKPELNETLQAENPTNRIVIVTKRSIPKLYIPLFREAGFHVYDLNYTDMMSGNCSDDPLSFVKTNEDIANLAHAIVMANERKEGSIADPFWDEASEALLGAEIGLVRRLNEKATFDDVLTLHSKLEIKEKGSGIETSLDEIFDKYEMIEPNSFIVSRWKTFREAAVKTAKSIFVSLNPTLQSYTEAVRQCMIELPSIDFEKFAKEKSILFITTSPVKKPLHRMANIYLSSVIAELFEIAEREESGRLPIPVHITFDDFATGARIADMPEKLSICREKKVSFTLMLQSEAQLVKMYGHSGSIEILDCCDSYVFMGGNNYETARNISLKLNVPLEETLYLPVGKAVVFRRGERPVISTRYSIRDDKFYQKIYNISKERG